MLQFLSISLPPAPDNGGSYSMQWLMVTAIVALTGVIVYLHKSSERKIDKFHKENKEENQSLLERLDHREESFTEERKARIKSLIEKQEEWTAALNEVKIAIITSNHLITANNKLWERMETLLVKIAPYLQK